MSSCRQFAIGFAVGFAVLLGCGSGSQSLPALVQRELGALKVLPSDPMNATVRDAVDIIHRLRACRVEHGDAGT